MSFTSFKKQASMQASITKAGISKAAISKAALVSFLVPTFVASLVSGVFFSSPARAEDPAPAGGGSMGSQPDAARVQSVTADLNTTGEATKTEIRIQLNNGNPNYSIFEAQNPNRLMIDISGATYGEGDQAPNAVATGLVSKIEFTHFDGSNNNTRVVLTLSGKVTHEHRVEGNTIILMLTPGIADDPMASELRLSGPQEIAQGPVLATLDFQQKERSSTVIMGLKNVEPIVATPRSDMITIDLPGATMPASLRRQLDTRFFASAVDEIKAYTTREGTRIAIKLRANTTYTVSREGELYLLEIVTPPEIIAAGRRAMERAASAAPGTPATNGTGATGNAANDAALITPNGRTLDPNSVYSNGSSPDTYSFARPTASAGQARYTGRRISIDLQDADIHTVFRFLADYGDVNIVASDDVDGKVTVRLVDVPWDEALAAVLQAKGLGAQQFGNIIRVATLEQIQKEEAAIAATAEERKKSEQLSILVVPLNYAQADELVDKVEVLLSERGTVEVDARGNQLIIQDNAESIAKIQATLAHVDKPNRQIIIEARFVEANSSFSQTLGIAWGADVDASAATGYPTGAYFPNSIQVTGSDDSSLGTVQNLMVDLGGGLTNGGGLGITLGSISGLIDLEVRLQALEQEGWGKIVSSPRLRVIDNETATVEQGARIPYLSTSQGGTNVQFVKASLEMSITPHITAEGTIFLDVTINNDRPDFGQQVQGQPAILTKQIHTRILVADGDTAVLGGVYSTSESWAQTRLPVLGKIPLIGNLFKATSKAHEQQEMLVFITPRIVPLDEQDNTGEHLSSM